MSEPTTAPRFPDDQVPPRRVRWLFWAILGAISVFFAEVTIGSMMFPFVHPWGLLVTCPLYALHILVLSTLVLERGRASFAALFFAGNLFGLYEAYITKALWNPPWHAALGGRIGGVAVLETMVLVLFWHAIMSFIVPLVAAERFLTSSTLVTGTLKPWLARHLDRRWFIVLVAAVFGFTDIMASPSRLQSLASTLSGTCLILVLLWLWRRWTRGHVYDLPSLLPDRRELVVLAALLATQYLGLGAGLHPELLPNLGAQASIWLLYLVFGVLLYAAIVRQEQPAIEPARAIGAPLPWTRWLWFTLIFAGVSTTLQPLGTALRDLIFVGIWIIGIVSGWILLMASLLSLIRSGLSRRSPVV